MLRPPWRRWEKPSGRRSVTTFLHWHLDSPALAMCQQAALATWKQPAAVIPAGHMSAANWLITSEPRPEWVKNSRKVVGYGEDMATSYVRWISMLPVEEQLELVPHPQAQVARFPEQRGIAASKPPTKHQRRELTRSGRRTDRFAPNEVAFWQGLVGPFISGRSRWVIFFDLGRYLDWDDEGMWLISFLISFLGRILV